MGGFSANIDPKEWNARHAETLKSLSQEQLEQYVPVARQSGHEAWLKHGGLIHYSVRRTNVLSVGPGLGQVAEEWRDAQTNALIAKRSRYGSGPVDDLRTWVVPRSCEDEIFADGEKSRFFEKLLKRGK